jgi:Fe-S cluster assembly ATP-binding protein
LVNAITNHPGLKVDGTIDDLLTPLFLGFQKPVEIPEILTGDFLLYLDNQFGHKSESLDEFILHYGDVLKRLHITESMFSRPLNRDVSGGENKRLELLQMYIIQPKFIMLDEIDTGLDLDMLVQLGGFLKDYIEEHNPIVLVVTHNLSFLKYFPVKRVIVLNAGEIIADKGPALIKELEAKGFIGTFPNLK